MNGLKDYKFQGPLKNGRSVLIEHVRVEDAAEILRYMNQISTESINLSFGPGELKMTLDEEIQFIQKLEDGKFNFMLKAEDQGRIVSACSVYRSPRPRLQHSGEFGLSVSQSHWGLGLGRQMCLAMIECCRQVGITDLQLKVREGNTKAIQLYESLGFQFEGRLPRAVKIDGVDHANLLMGLDLSL